MASQKLCFPEKLGRYAGREKKVAVNDMTVFSNCLENTDLSPSLCSGLLRAFHMPVQIVNIQDAFLKSIPWKE